MESLRLDQFGHLVKAVIHALLQIPVPILQIPPELLQPITEIQQQLVSFLLRHRSLRHTPNVSLIGATVKGLHQQFSVSVAGVWRDLISRTLYPPEDSDADDASETVFGLSAQALPMVGVGDGVYMTAGLKLAYHFLHVDSEPELPDNYDYTGGLALSVSLGYGFRF